MFKKAKLISVVDGVDESGDLTQEELEKVVFVKQKSIGQAEFYRAFATGLKPELKLELKKFEYDNQRKIKFRNKTYSVIRTFSNNENTIELILGGEIDG